MYVKSEFILDPSEFENFENNPDSLKKKVRAQTAINMALAISENMDQKEEDTPEGKTFTMSVHVISAAAMREIHRLLNQVRADVKTHSSAESDIDEIITMLGE